MGVVGTVLWTTLQAAVFSMPTLLLIVPIVKAGNVRRAGWHLTIADCGILALLLAGLCRLSLALHFWKSSDDAVQHVVALGLALLFWWCVVAVTMSRAAINKLKSRMLLHCVVLIHGCFFPGVLHFSRQSAFTGDSWLVFVAWFPCYLISLVMVWLIVEVRHAVR